MKYNPEIHHRRSIRLKGYDYSQAGLYFITICTRDRQCLFGKIADGEMVLNDAGKIAKDYLKNVPEKYNQTRMHEFVVMPNHVHAIIEITDGGVRPDVGAIHESPLHESSPPASSKPESPLRDQRRKMLLSKIMGWYKMNVAKQINIIRLTEGTPLWQRNYYEYIIRNKKSYQTIADYIINNPAKWDDDKFFVG
ncbi:MAG: transposase [Bacteroidia bacterium]|nr:transposase [Bacteroidia bacterium]